MIPEEMDHLMNEENGEAGNQRYILVKLLNYGPEPNYQIRPTQSIGAISKLTSQHADCLAYRFGKTLIKLLGIKNIGNYLLKKSFLRSTNYYKDFLIGKNEREHEQAGLLALMGSPEFANIFARKKYFTSDENVINEGIIFQP